MEFSGIQQAKLYDALMIAKGAQSADVGALMGEDVGALLCAPVAPASLSHLELVTRLEQVLRPSSTWRVRRALYSVRRAPGESLCNWARRLQRLAKSAGLGEERHDVLRDVFLLGLDLDDAALDSALDVEDHTPPNNTEYPDPAVTTSQTRTPNVTKPTKMKVENKQTTVAVQHNVTAESVHINEYQNQSPQVPTCPMPYELPKQLAAFLAESRDQETLDLHAALETPAHRGLVLHGFPGVGKSELAIHYARTYLDFYQNNVIWLHYNAEHFEEKFRAMVKEFNILERPDRSINVIVREFYNHISKEISLIIFDDVLSENDIQKYLPDGPDTNTKIIITSPNSDWVDFQRVLINPFTRVITEIVLKSGLQNPVDFNEQTKNDWEELLTLLDGMPLAIQLAAYYLSKGYQLSNLSDKIKQDGSIFKENNSIFLVRDYKLSIYEAIETTINRIKGSVNDTHVKKTVEDIVNYCAYLHHGTIQIPLLLKLCQHLSSTDSETTQKNLQEAKAKLCEFSFITEENDHISINRLVQRVVQVRLQTDGGPPLHSIYYRNLVEFILDDRKWCILSASEKETIIQMYKVIVKCLLECEADINVVYEKILNPLMVAAARGMEDVAKLLISRGVKTDEPVPRDKHGDTPLHLAARAGHADMCLMLLDHCSDDVKNWIGRTPIHVAVEQGQLKVVKVLIEKNPDSVSWTSRGNNTPVHLAAKHGYVYILRYFLEERKIAVDTFESSGWTPLMAAARKGQTGTVRWLLERGASLKVHDPVYEYTALQFACVGGHVDTVELLIAKVDTEEIQVSTTGIVGAAARYSCSSPKGKQLVVSSNNGSLTQYKPDLKAVKMIPAPALGGTGPLCALSFCWVSNYQFARVFRSLGDEDARPFIVMLNAPKAVPTTYINNEDICYNNRTLRPTQYYIIYQPTWGVMLVTSANSMEVSVLGVIALSEPALWQQWNQIDAGRAELPLSAAHQETFPVNVALDTGVTLHLSSGENHMLLPMPLIHLLSHHGVSMINFRAGAPSVCVQPEPVADMSGMGMFITPSPAILPAAPPPQPQHPPPVQIKQLPHQPAPVASVALPFGTPVSVVPAFGSPSVSQTTFGAPASIASPVINDQLIQSLFQEKLKYFHAELQNLFLRLTTINLDVETDGRNTDLISTTTTNTTSVAPTASTIKIASVFSVATTENKPVEPVGFGTPKTSDSFALSAAVSSTTTATTTNTSAFGRLESCVFSKSTTAATTTTAANSFMGQPMYSPSSGSIFRQQSSGESIFGGASSPAITSAFVTSIYGHTQSSPFGSAVTSTTSTSGGSIFSQSTGFSPNTATTTIGSIFEQQQQQQQNTFGSAAATLAPGNFSLTQPSFAAAPAPAFGEPAAFCSPLAFGGAPAEGNMFENPTPAANPGGNTFGGGIVSPLMFGQKPTFGSPPSFGPPAATTPATTPATAVASVALSFGTPASVVPAFGSSSVSQTTFGAPASIASPVINDQLIQSLFQEKLKYFNAELQKLFLRLTTINLNVETDERNTDLVSTTTTNTTSVAPTASTIKIASVFSVATTENKPVEPVTSPLVPTAPAVGFRTPKNSDSFALSAAVSSTTTVITANTSAFGRFESCVFGKPTTAATTTTAANSFMGQPMYSPPSGSILRQQSSDRSIFGGANNPAITSAFVTSIYGHTQSSPFGSAVTSTTSTSGGSIFSQNTTFSENTATTTIGSIFEQQQQQQQQNTFGSAAATLAPGNFSLTQPSFAAAPAPAFGEPAAFCSPLAFGGAPAEGNLFEKPTPAAYPGGNTFGGGIVSPSMFGQKPTFGSRPSFGRPAATTPATTPATAGAFGTDVQKNSTFAKLATQPTLDFGNLVQNQPTVSQPQQQQFSEGAQFSS